MKKKPIKIRRARIEDCLKIKNMHLHSIRKLCAKDYTKKQIEAWTSGRTANGCRNAIKSGEVMLVALCDDRIVGFASRLADEIRAVYVHPRYVGRGVGRKLLGKLETEMLKKGIKKVSLYSTLTSFLFYEKQGYKKIRKQWYKLNNGVVLPVIKMTKLLTKAK